MHGSEVMPAGAPVGRYEIISLLSAGGMGEVYLARDPELQRDLVVKFLPRRGHEIVSRLRAQFTEGFETPDLLAADRLLGEPIRPGNPASTGSLI